MLTLVIGGASSGKSAVAEDLVMAVPGRRAYVATMQPFGKQAEARVARHLKMRENKGMATIEQYTDLGEISAKAAEFDVLLIECMTNLAANEQFSPETAGNPDIPGKICGDILKLSEVCVNIVVVSCDLFQDGNSYPNETMEYMANLGRLNCLLAEKADRVIEVFYGLIRELKPFGGEGGAADK